ncbi:GDP-D-glucose phosphorylase 1 [Vanessa atalanta]|uniref:GDP-D-glucose phosphorylase 1 n=1 Tax=Vanessa atalanta TaxID=42275 RepID=UPI001FCDAECB|nr:GDP-D-glucose phosphorylase 1 [Vanessa atalanta]
MIQIYDFESKQLIEDKSSKFLPLLKSKWNDIHSKANVFRYKILNLQERLLNEKYLLQLNPSRQSNRRYPEQINDICQPFDEKRFNFTKVSKEEIIFTFKENDEGDSHAVLVNVSPISKYHSLICPSIYKCLPQVITKESLKLAIDLMLLTQDRTLRIGFNSLCAFASVNHLHYHLFIEKQRLYVENANCNKIKGPLFKFDESYPVPAFCFEVFQGSEKVDDIFILLNYLLQKSIAHNVMMTRGDPIEGSREEVVRVLVWPRKSSMGAKQLVAFNVAVCELSGWFPIYDSEEYENLQEENLENELRKWKIDNFEELCEELKLLY